MPPFRVVSAVLAAAIGVLPLVPPEHVHDTRSADGHHGVVAHRHAGAHTHGHPHVHEHTTAGGHGRDHHQVDDPGGLSHDHADLAAASRAPGANAGEYREATRTTVSTAGGSKFDDDDSVVATAEGVFVAPSAYSSAAPSVLATHTVALLPLLRPAGRVVEVTERLIHGPPRGPTPLRGPPASAHL